MVSRYFFTALWHETIKRIPYMLAILAVLILIIGFKSYQNTLESIRVAKVNSETNKTLLQKVSGLSEDNKRLSEQNNQLAQENARHIDCEAELFAQYTRDQQPIQTVDLKTCTIVKSGVTQLVKPSPTSSQAPTSPRTTQTQPTTTSDPPKQPSSPPAPPTPKPKDPGIIPDNIPLIGPLL